jgi:hypothetical protein
VTVRFIEKKAVKTNELFDPILSRDDLVNAFIEAMTGEG